MLTGAWTARIGVSFGSLLSCDWLVYCRLGQCLCSLSSDPPGKLNVFGHNGDTFGVDCAQIGVLK